MKTKVILLAIALSAITGVVASQDNTPENPQQGYYFTDTNNNGICDNFEKGNGGNNPTGDGVRLRDGSGRTSGRGRGAFQGQGMRNGCCQGQGVRNGRGQGVRDGRGTGGRGAYVDANKNGICDYQEQTK